jgi:predicted solute-binding protein
MVRFDFFFFENNNAVCMSVSITSFISVSSVNLVENEKEKTKYSKMTGTSFVSVCTCVLLADGLGVINKKIVSRRGFLSPLGAFPEASVCAGVQLLTPEQV